MAGPKVTPVGPSASAQGASRVAEGGGGISGARLDAALAKACDTLAKVIAADVNEAWAETGDRFERQKKASRDSQPPEERMNRTDKKKAEMDKWGEAGEDLQESHEAFIGSLHAPEGSLDDGDVGSTLAVRSMQHGSQLVNERRGKDNWFNSNILKKNDFHYWMDREWLDEAAEERANERRFMSDIDRDEEARWTDPYYTEAADLRAHEEAVLREQQDRDTSDRAADDRAVDERLSYQRYTERAVADRLYDDRMTSGRDRD